MARRFQSFFDAHNWSSFSWPVVGTRHDDHIVDMSGNSRIYASRGDDLVEPGEGNDNVAGG